MILSKSNIDGINLETFVDSIITSNQLDTILLVVPTNRKLREFKKKIINNFSSFPISNIYIETLTTLSTNLLKNIKSFITLNEAMSSVLIKKAAHELELSYFAAYGKGIPYGTLDKIKNVISEYKRHGISPDILRSEADKLERGEKSKAHDIADIYQLYLRKCHEKSAYDIGDIYSKLLTVDKSLFHTQFLKSYPSIKHILFQGFDQFTDLESDLINGLSNIVDNKLFIELDYYKNSQLFSHIDKTIENLKTKGFREISDKRPMDLSSFRNVLRQNLFIYRNDKPTDKFKDIIFSIRAGDRYQEMEFVAKKIKQQINFEKISPYRICIAFNSIQKYSSIVRDVFHEYGIPFNLTDRISLKSSQPVVAVMSLLDLINNDFYFRDIVKVISNKLFSFSDIDLHNLIQVANELKITKGYYNWISSLDDAAKLVKFNDELTDDEKRKRIKKYMKAETDIKYLNDLLHPLNKRNNAENFIVGLKRILLKLQLPQEILKNTSGREEEFTKALTVFLQTSAEIFRLSDDSNSEHSISYFTEQLRTIANWARFNIKERSDQGVLITSVNEIRGLNFDTLYLCGMCDGDFPTKYSPEIFFSGSFQKKEQLHQMEERFHFYQALSTWNKKLVITIPKFEGETELVESSLIKDFENVFRTTEYVPDRQSILSIKELLVHYSHDNASEVFKKNLLDNEIDESLIDFKSSIFKRRKENVFAEDIFAGHLNQEDQIIGSFLEEFSNKQFSISQLETYAKCPFKYFTDRILKIQTVDEPMEEVEPIELGNVLHSILAEFYSIVNSQKIHLNSDDTEEFQKAQEILFGLAEQKIDELNLNSPITFFEKEKILGIDGRKENSILYKFLTQESQNTNFKPTFFEQKFGRFNEHELMIDDDINIDGIKIRGKIDRIDINPTDSLFNVIDYKRKGRKPTARDLDLGLSLQLPVYLIASEKILTNLYENDLDAYKMIIYSLDYKENNFGPFPINLSRKKSLSREEFKELNYALTSKTKQIIMEFHEKISKGAFNLSSLDDREERVCKYCDFRSFCRVSEVFEF